MTLTVTSRDSGRNLLYEKKILWEKRFYYRVHFLLFCWDQVKLYRLGQQIHIVNFIKVKCWNDYLFIPLATENNSMIDCQVYLTGQCACDISQLIQSAQYTFVKGDLPSTFFLIIHM